MSPNLLEILFLAPILAVAGYHAGRFDKNIPTGKWFHFLWGCVFGAAIILLWFLQDKDYIFAGCLVLERFIFFSPILNYLRHPRKPFFYIHKKLQGENGSWQDEIIGKAFVPVWVLSVIGFIIFQFFL